MNKDIRPPAWFALAVAAAFLGAFSALLLTDFAVVRADWCGGQSTGCIREWVGALSGWAAAIAASATIFVLWRQLASLQQQTDWAIGRAAPTLIVLNAGDRDVQLRIVNWNRNPIDLKKLTIQSLDSSELKVTRTKVGSAYYFKEQPTSQRTIENMRLAGWEHRSDAPPHVEIEVQIDKDFDALSEIAITIFAVQLGSQEAPITLTATGSVAPLS